jgi:GrpB-like predicted nucleotidyltransferase (UPF0157 family)
MAEEAIYLVPYNPNWPNKFEAEKKLVEQTLGTWIKGGVEHVGSTSMPGMTAKPVIDIMVGVEDLERAKACIPLLESIGYCYAPYKPELMHWFCKPSLERREYHLYLMEPTSDEWKARIAFRDYLKKHANIAQEYLKLKQDLASRYKNDREAYTQAKESFVKEVTLQALSPTPGSES